MNTRLKQFLAAENISQSQFADTINVVRASVSHVLAGRNRPGYDFIKAIMLAYPHLNMDWLILGKGKMYRSAVQEIAPEDLSYASALPSPSEVEIPQLFGYDQEQDTPAFGDLQPGHGTHSSFNTEVAAQSPSSNKTNTSYSNIQTTANQRKAVKITIFYDDGTYQEVQNL